MTAAISNHTGSLANAQRYYSQHRKDADAVAANLLATPAGRKVKKYKVAAQLGGARGRLRIIVPGASRHHEPAVWPASASVWPAPARNSQTAPQSERLQTFQRPEEASEAVPVEAYAQDD